MKWSDIESSDRWQQFAPEQKAAARAKYFDDFVAPKAPQNFDQADLRTRWMTGYEGSAPSRSFGTHVKDRALSMGSGALKAIGGMVDIANTDYGTGLPAGMDAAVGIGAGVLGRFGSDQAREASDALNAAAKPRSDYMSSFSNTAKEYADTATERTSTQEKDKRRQLGEASGFTGTLAHLADNPSLIPELAADSIPYMAAGAGAGGLVARAGLGARAAIGANLGTQAGMSSSASAQEARGMIESLPDDELSQLPEYQELSDKYDAPTSRKILSQRANDQAFASGLLINAATLGFTAKFSAVEQAMHGVTASGSRVMNAVFGGSKELTQEAIQGAGEQVSTNIGASASDQRVGLTDNVGESALLEGVVGGPMGAIAGLTQSRSAPEPPAPPRPYLPTEEVDEGSAPMTESSGPTTFDESGGLIEPGTDMEVAGPLDSVEPPDFMVSPEGEATRPGDYIARAEARAARDEPASTMAVADMAQAAFDSTIEAVHSETGKPLSKAAQGVIASRIAERFGADPAALIERNLNPVRAPQVAPNIPANIPTSPDAAPDQGVPGFATSDEGAIAAPQAAAVEQNVPQTPALTDELLKVDPEERPEAFGLPPRRKKNTQKRTINDFDENHDDLIPFMALAGGLNRAEFKRHGVDPANWTTMEAQRKNRPVGFGIPLFRDTGGMTLSELREKMEEWDFLSHDDQDGERKNYDDDALALVMDAVNSSDKVFNLSGREIQSAIAGIKHEQATYNDEVDKANSMGTNIDAMYDEVSRSEAVSEMRKNRVASLQDERQAMSTAELYQAIADAGGTEQQADDIDMQYPSNEREAPLRALLNDLERSRGHDRRATKETAGAGVQPSDRRAVPAPSGSPAATKAPAEADEVAQLRARVAELEASASTSEVTGLRGKAAFDADESLGWNTVSAIDMDGLGRLNDHASHQEANKVMRSLAAAMRAVSVDGVRFYHLHGDEFAARFSDPEAAARIMPELQSELSSVQVPLDVTLEDGVVRAYSYDGIGITFGLGANYATADASAIRSKREREAAGHRQNKNQPGAPRQLRDLAGDTERRKSDDRRNQDSSILGVGQELTDERSATRQDEPTGQVDPRGVEEGARSGADAATRQARSGADDARTAAEPLTLTDDTPARAPVAQRPASQSGLFGEVTDIDRERLRYEAKKPPTPTDNTQVDLEEVIQTPPSGGVSTSVVADAAAQAATSPKNALPEPTQAQKEAGNYTKGKLRLHGLDISIENPAGTKRHPEWPPLKNHYGYIRGTEGRDGEQIDVFLSDKADDPKRPVFVIDQIDPKTGRFDEHKVMLGWPNEIIAKSAYRANYASNWKGLGKIRRFTLEQFKVWLSDANTKKPASAVKPAATAAPKEKQDGTVQQSAQETQETPIQAAGPEPDGRIEAQAETDADRQTTADAGRRPTDTGNATDSTVRASAASGPGSAQSVDGAGAGAADDAAASADPGKFSQPEQIGSGVPIADLRRMAGAASVDGVTVIAVESPEGFPAAAKRDPSYRTAEAWTDGKGMVYLAASAMASMDRARMVLAHEVKGHVGVERVIGDEWPAVQAAIDELRNGRGPLDRRLRDAIASAARRYPNADRATFTKEAIAIMAENGVTGSLWDRIVASVRRWLRTTFNRFPWSEAEIRDLLRRGDEAVQGEPDPGLASGLGYPADENGMPAFSNKASPFYSALVESVDRAQGAPKRGTAKQWKEWLDGAQRRGEFKQSERDWIGVDAWLDGQEDITRAQLMEFVKANQVQVQDVVLGDNEGLIEKIGVRETESGKFEVFFKEDGQVYGEYSARSDAEDARTRALRALEKDTKFQQYVLPGGKSYRELLITLPDDFGAKPNADGYIPASAMTDAQFRSGHFGEPNILAHVRFNERTDADGKRVLFVEEVQSDWHQKGRKEGYKGGRFGVLETVNENRVVQYFDSKANAEARAAELSEQLEALGFGPNGAEVVDPLAAVPNAPFKTTWPLTAMKRVIRYAAENGFDRVAWTTGEQQAERYDLSKKISEVVYEDGSLLAYDHDGNQVIGRTVAENSIADYIGKDAAEKLLAKEPNKDGARAISGLDLKVGGEGMKAFYDKMLPNEVGKYVKQWGGKVGQTTISVDSGGGTKFRVRWVEDGSFVDETQVYDTRVEAERSAKAWNEQTGDATDVVGVGEVSAGSPIVHSIDITPTMRASVLEGQPLFSKPEADNAANYRKANERIREQNVTVWAKAKKWLQRQLTPAGLLPSNVFDEKIKRDSAFEVIEFDVAHLIGQLERAIKRDYLVSPQRLAEKTQQMLTDMLAGKVEGLPEATTTALLGMRQYIDALSLRYIKVLGAQAKELAEVAERDGSRQAVQDAEERIALMDVIAGNIGTYVHRSYRAFDDPKWATKVPDATLNAAREYLLAGLREKGVPNPESRVEVILNEILKEGTAYGGIEAFIRESKLGAKDLSVLQKRKQIAPEIRALLGEYTDPRINFAKSATKMGRLIWNQSFLDRVRKIGMGEFLFTDANKPPEATARIAAEGSEVYAPLNGLWVTPEINQAFKDALGKEEMANWYRNWVKINGLVKYGKTVLSPTTAARNWMSAFFFTVANGHFDMRHMGKSFKSGIEYFTHNGKAENLAYLRKLKALGVVYDTPYAGEMMRLLADARSTDKLGLSGGKLKLGAAFDYATKFYQYGDDFWKIIGFENERQLWMGTGMSEADAEAKAAERIRNTYPTYSMIGRGVQSLRRFPLVGTFVSFPAEIIRTSYNMVRYLAEDSKNPKTRTMAMRRAAGMAIASSFAYAAQALSMAMLGMDDDDEEAVRLMAAPWQRNSALLFTGRDDDGNIRYLDMSFLDPYNYWKRPIMAVTRGQPVDDAIRDVFAETLGPFFGVEMTTDTVFQVLANKKDTGAPVYKEHDTIPSQTLDIAEHLRKSLQPGLISNMERTWKALEGEVAPSGKKYDKVDEAAAWFGFRMSTLDPKIALYYRSFEFQDATQQAEKKLRDTIRDPGAVSDKALRSAYDTTMRLREQAFKEMILLTKAAERSGAGRIKAGVTLRSSGLSDAEVTSILKGRVPPWFPSGEKIGNDRKKVFSTFGEGPAKQVSERYRRVGEFARGKK